jgi:hypothetical protein
MKDAKKKASIFIEIYGMDSLGLHLSWLLISLDSSASSNKSEALLLRGNLDEATS